MTTLRTDLRPDDRELAWPPCRDAEITAEIGNDGGMPFNFLIRSGDFRPYTLESNKTVTDGNPGLRDADIKFVAILPPEAFLFDRLFRVMSEKHTY